MITDQKQPSPLILVPRDCLSTRAIKELRKAGYNVVIAKDTGAVKQFYPQTFNAVSDQAKIASFEHLLAQGGEVLTKSHMREIYVFFLKKLAAF